MLQCVLHLSLSHCVCQICSRFSVYWCLLLLRSCALRLLSRTHTHTQPNGTHALALSLALVMLPCNVITQTTPLASSILMAPSLCIYPFGADNNNDECDKMLISMRKWISGFTHPPILPSFCVHTTSSAAFEWVSHELLIRGKIVKLRPWSLRESFFFFFLSSFLWQN